MKNEGIQRTKRIRIPELSIHGVCEKVINWTSHVKNFYWLMMVTAFLVLFLVLMPHYHWIDFWMSLKAQTTLVSMVLIFSLVAVSLVWSMGQRVDDWVFMVFNMRGQRAPWLDWMMLALTQMGNGIFAILVAVTLFLLGNNMLAYELAFGTLTIWLVVEFAKVLIRRTRPYIKLKKIRIIGSRASGHSFPSGHTSQVFFMTTLMLHYYNVGFWLWVGLYAVSVLVGITRIYVGMHYPRDVLGGAMLGTAWGLLGVIVNNYIGRVGW